MKLWSLRSAYNNYEIIVVTAWSWIDTSTFVVTSCDLNSSVAKYYLGGSNAHTHNPLNTPHSHHHTITPLNIYTYNYYYNVLPNTAASHYQNQNRHILSFPYNVMNMYCILRWPTSFFQVFVWMWLVRDPAWDIFVLKQLTPQWWLLIRWIKRGTGSGMSTNENLGL